MSDDLEHELTLRPGTTPAAVRAAVAAELENRPRLVMPAPTRRQVDQYFGELAELVKRARGEP